MIHLGGAVRSVPAHRVGDPGLNPGTNKKLSFLYSYVINSILDCKLYSSYIWGFPLLNLLAHINCYFSYPNIKEIKFLAKIWELGNKFQLHYFFCQIVLVYYYAAYVRKFSYICHETFYVKVCLYFC